MRTCGVCNTQAMDSVHTCPRCGADLRANSQTALARARMQKNDRVRLIRIAVAHDCCPACAAVQGAHPKDAAPDLPVEGCSHAHGCRCYYEPVLSEVYP